MNSVRQAIETIRVGVLAAAAILSLTVALGRCVEFCCCEAPEAGTRVVACLPAFGAMEVGAAETIPALAGAPSHHHCRHRFVGLSALAVRGDEGARRKGAGASPLAAYSTPFRARVVRRGGPQPTAPPERCSSDGFHDYWWRACSRS